MKQELVSTARKLGVLSIAERFRYFTHWLRESPRNREFIKSHTAEAFPPTGALYDAMSSMDYEAYFTSGTKVAKVLYGMYEPYLPQTQASICEWGCGPARIIRHLRTIDSSRSLKLFGTDYNPVSIEWCQKSITGVSFHLNKLAPPLPFEDNQFDCLYCVSVFTHLSEEMHHAWIKELFRVVKPGGVVLITTHGDNFVPKLTPGEKETYSKGDLVIRGRVLEGSRMYTAFHPPVFVRKMLADHEILVHQPKPDPVVAGGQDVWITRKV